ncbi:hypothetical protein FHS85_003614 [Rhodoligotrophos appendicifer]
MVVEQDPPLLGVEPLCLRMQGLDTFEQSFVEIDCAEVAGENGREFTLDSFDVRVSVRPRQIEKDRAYSPQRESGPFHRLDGVSEAGRVGLIGNQLDCVSMQSQGSLESWGKVAGFYLLERRNFKAPNVL